MTIYLTTEEKRAEMQFPKCHLHTDRHTHGKVISLHLSGETKIMTLDFSMLTTRFQFFFIFSSTTGQESADLSFQMYTYYR